MAAIKLQKFLGAAPKVSGELLPDGAAQTATNIQLYSGDLLPYPEAFASDSIPRIGTIKTIFGIRNPSTNALEWLSWLTDVDIVTISDSNDDELRFYYTGDGVPKVTTHALATTGSEPYPVSSGFYDLGLPLPTTTAIATAVASTSATSAKFERDAGNTAIITTAAVHGFRSGQIVTVRDFSTSPSDELNVTNTRITVTSTTTFEYFNAGDAVAETTNTEATIDLAGGTITRDYVYTWYTPWGEESIASNPSTTLFIKEGQTVVITALPTAAPTGDNQVTAMRFYRTLTSASGTEFFRLSTLYFPAATTTVSLTSNVATVTMAVEHSLIVGDRFKLSGCTDSVFNIIDGIVTVVGSDTKFSYAVTNANITEKADTTGKLYHDASEVPANDPPMYWGDAIATSLRERTSNVSTMTTAVNHDLLSNQVVAIAGMTDTTFNETAVTVTVTGNTTFTYPNTGSNAGSASDTGGTVTNYSFLDNFDFINLVDLLITDDFNAPNAAMTGIVEVQNNLIAGFFGNQLAFAEPGKPWAWPEKYRRTFEHDIVALVAVGGFLLVLTEEFAFRVSGSDPATLAVARIDNPYPCLSKKSVVNMGYGAVFATYGGLALWAPSTGMTFVTEFVHEFDTFDSTLDPSTVVGHFFNDKYYASYDTGAFIFEQDKKIGGFYVTTGHKFNSAWTDPSTGIMYTSSDALGNISQWGNDDNILGPYEWKSKVIVTKDYINIGAARVIADFAVTAEDSAAYTAYNLAVAAYNTAVWVDSEQLGSINGPTDYVDSSGVTINNLASFNTSIVNGPGTPLGLLRSRRTAPSLYDMIFKLYHDKSLVFTKSVSDNSVFRCPVGYKSDTFEVSVAGVARTRAIHIGETPDGLRKA